MTVKTIDAAFSEFRKTLTIMDPKADHQSFAQGYVAGWNAKESQATALSPQDGRAAEALADIAELCKFAHTYTAEHLGRKITDKIAAALAPKGAAMSEKTDKAADAAMLKLWKEWFEFYNSHFRAGNVQISAADQMAFYEIAQPIMRALALPRADGGAK